MDESASYWHFQFPAQAICVIGPDLVVAIGYIYISTVVESWEVAVAGASLQYFLSLAFVAGPSLSTLIYKSLVFKKHGTTIVTLLFLRDMGKTSGKPQTTVNKGELPPPTDDKASLTLNAPGAALESGRREEESRDD
ncbi:hypothetical protein QFC22_004180 [Naganishia vaughanmartiniae]|uniref:Uncharacterized protein n=1 Tax=Naganishia vaughanmartiniae TaxID=1424756 RepID=A0ACC2X2K3_9TREE|nr:hypothetical protein QFC22_004180 [Naganishia vaughanmartiniae]